MLVRIIIYWIALQLVVCGGVEADIENKVVEGTYNCMGGTVPVIIGMIFPLVAVLPDRPQWIKFCEGKR